jgi:hypothetical protein
MKTPKSIYGPDLSESESEGARIAKMGLACMEGDQKTGEESEHSGKAVSRSELDHLLKED